MSAIKIYCTDKAQFVDGYILNLNKGKFLEAAINTVKVRMPFNTRSRQYVGSMAGYEFVVKEADLPEEHQEYSRSKR
jgi:hypothetical protein